jgi:cytochrome c biogenesis protein CcdA
MCTVTRLMTSLCPYRPVAVHPPRLPASTIRWAGLIALLLLGIGLIVPRVEALLEAPFSRVPSSSRLPSSRGGFLLGLVLGTVYVPCAGPVLAAITVAGATGTVGTGTIALTAEFAVGTAATLLVFAFAGQAVVQRVKASGSGSARSGSPPASWWSGWRWRGSRTWDRPRRERCWSPICGPRHRHC